MILRSRISPHGMMSIICTKVNYGHHIMKMCLESMKNEQDAKFWSLKKPQIYSLHIEDFFKRKTSRLPFFVIIECGFIV